MGQRNAALNKSPVDLIKGLPHNGNVFSRRCTTLDGLDAALSETDARDIFVNFLLEDREGNTRSTTDVNEARQHLANS
jgi:hypothetical protein